MADELTAAVASRLAGAFGQEYTVYVQDVLQGLETPCFFVRPLRRSRRALPGGRYLQDCLYDVALIPAPGGEEGLMDAGETLLALLELVPLPDGRPVRGVDMHFAVSDGVLHLSVRYGMALRTADTAENMQIVDTRSRIG